MTQHPAQLDWQRADILLLDMDGTILDLRFDNHFWTQALPERYAQVHGMTKQDAVDRLAPRFEALYGQLDWYCVEFWSSELDVDVMALKRELAQGIGLLPGAEAFLQAQVDAGRRLWLVTNAHPQTLALKVERTGIDRYFERCVTSHELGHAKEDAQFWAAFDEHCPVPRAGRVMFDDNIRVLDAAKAHGVDQCVQITCPDSGQSQPHQSAEGFLAVRGLFELV